MPNRTEARPAKAVLTYATGRLPLLRLFSTPLKMPLQGSPGVGTRLPPSLVWRRLESEALEDHRRARRRYLPVAPQIHPENERSLRDGAGASVVDIALNHARRR
jgi:hypothetical protein